MLLMDVEEVAKVGAEAELAALLVDELPQHDDAVRARSLARLVLELGGVLGDQTLVEVAALLHDFTNDR
jgi:hypothetical protein